MKFRSIMVAVLAALTLAACSDNDEPGGSNIDPADGDPARVSLSFTVPVTGTMTRTIATDTGEADIKNVMVYLFRSSTGAAITGNNSDFDFASLASNSNGGYDIPDITSIAVTADVYVVINHPEYGNPAANYATRDELLSDVEKVEDMSHSGKFTMVASDKSLQLEEYDPADPTTVTEVTLSAGRVVAKVVASTDQATYDAVWYTDPSDDNSGVINTLTYTIKGFNVYQEALKSYIVGNTTTYSPYAYPADRDAFSPYAVSVWKNNKAVGAGPLTHGTDDAAITALERFYIGENNPGTGETLNENTTYVMIATKVQPTHYAKWNTTTNEVEWDVVSNYSYTADDDMYVIHYKGLSYITRDANERDELCYGLGGALTPLSYYVYPESYVHFQVFLNGKNLAGQSDKNIYNVLRNQLIHVKITGLNAAGNYFPGYPGGDGDGTPEENGGTGPDPEKPIDPNDKNDPNNPDPREPDEKVDPEDSLLRITIEIDDWDYAENAVELE